MTVARVRGVRTRAWFRHAVMVSLAVSLVAVASSAWADPLQAVASQMRTPLPAEIDAARTEARAALTRLRNELADRAIGVVLTPELKLDQLIAALDAPAIAPEVLDEIEVSLRRTVPGDAGRLVDRLRASVARLARLARLDDGTVAEGRRALDAIRVHLSDPTTPDGDDETDATLRAAFATLARLVPDEQTTVAVRRRLSTPNEGVFVGRSFVEAAARQSFTVPVGSRTRSEGTTVSGTGSVRIDLAATLPPADGASVLRMHAVGTGRIDATADRRRVHVRARATPDVTGTDDVRILWDRVVGGEPDVQARFRSQLAGVRIDAVIGRCRLVKAIASRAIQDRLAESDPQVSRQIERDVAARVKEESLSLAYRLNGLLQWGVWDRLAAIDFTPEVWLCNDEAGARSDTWYAGPGQLGAVRPRPPLPTSLTQPVAVATWVHESAITNSLARLGGIRLDEATVRGLWEVQCKLTCDEWTDLAPARIPSAITLADDEPLRVRFTREGFDVRLRMKACEHAGRPVATGSREVSLAYRLGRDERGPVLTRASLSWADGTPAEDRGEMEQAIGLFLGRTIRPLPRYRTSGFAKFLQVAHLELRDGWLAVAATEDDRREPTSAPRAPVERPPSSLPPAPVPPPTGDLAARFAPMELLFCFQGKGSCLPYDGGVLHEAYARIPAFRQGRVIVAGNSSGAIPAAYFGCHGFNDATVRHAEERLQYGNRDAVRNMENVATKISKLSRGQSTEIEHAELREFVAFALGVARWQDTRSIDEIVRRSTRRPQHPCLIVACNKEVLEDVHPQDRFAAGRLKEFDMDTMQVSWKPEVHDWYRRHPEQFRGDHPDLVLGADRAVGRGVTFFVDQSLYDLLSRIPAKERIADLRLMTDAADVALAILASASEPTYFPVVVDPHPEKILAADGGDVLRRVRKRTYYGGYIISMPAHDVRRMLPGIRVLGTGWRHNPLVARTLLKNWLLADCEEVAQRSEWWADMEINPDAEFESHIEYRGLSGVEEFGFGQRRARALFDAGGGKPAFVKRPRFTSAAAAAIEPAAPRPDTYDDAAGPDGARPLRTLRGLGHLVQPP
ncbi:MAG: hypothetical protein RLZZ21_1251 [Planctomycetota bacterium]